MYVSGVTVCKASVLMTYSFSYLLTKLLFRAQSLELRLTPLLALQGTIVLMFYRLQNKQLTWWWQLNAEVNVCEL